MLGLGSGLDVRRSAPRLRRISTAAARGKSRRRVGAPARVAGILFAAIAGLALLPAQRHAHAQVTVQFGDSVRTATQKTGKNADSEQSRIEKDINDGLKERAQADADAEALYDSKQTLRIVCFGDPEATKAGLTQGSSPVTGGKEPAATAGAFDAAGKPLPNATVIIAIDCSMLVDAKGFDAPAVPADRASMLEVLFHELAHAANQARRHGPTEAFDYQAWVRAFVDALASARKAAPVAPPNPNSAGDQTFSQRGRARDARRILEQAEIATGNCDPAAYQQAIQELLAKAGELRAAASTAGTATATADRLRADAQAYQALADRLAAEAPARFKNCTPPAGAQLPAPPGQPAGPPPTAPGTVPGTAPTPPTPPFGAVTPPRPDYALNVSPGGNVSWMPRVSGGTIIPNLGVAGSELPLVWSPRTITGGGIQFDAKIPLSIAPLDREWTFVPRVLYHYAEGTASGAIQPGRSNVGRTFLSPAPDGSTGVFYGMTGQGVEIRSRAHQIGADLIVGTQLFRGAVSGWRYDVFVGGGFSYRFDWTGHTIDERNLSFDNIWSGTELTTDNHFFGARLAAGAKLENGAWHGGVAAYVTPGVLFGTGSATQRNVCALCAPAVQDFSLKHENSRTAFGVRTGVDLHLGYRITRSLSVGGFFSLDYSSSQTTWVNPVKPSKAPPDLRIQDATSLRFGATVNLRF